MENAELRARITNCWGSAPDAEAVEAGDCHAGPRRAQSGRAHQWDLDRDDWIKKAILMYFRVAGMQTYQMGPYGYGGQDTIETNLEAQGVRLVPPGHVRYGSFLERGCVVIPGYVNIGAYVGAGTMVDTWATVGSCAQISAGVHLWWSGHWWRAGTTLGISSDH